MPWSEEQKYAARLELRNRRDTETLGSRRAAFLKATFSATAGLILTYILVWSALHGAEERIRIESAFIAIVTATLVVFALLLAYVRYLDWRRGARSRADTFPS